MEQQRTQLQLSVSVINGLKSLNTCVIGVVVITCPALISPTNGEKNSSAHTCGTNVEFSCNEGFLLSGSSIRACQPSGIWNYPQASCEGVPIEVLLIIQGVYCFSALDVDECLSSVCANGGRCINTIGGFYCTCTAYFMGTHCETRMDSIYIV